MQQQQTLRPGEGNTDVFGKTLVVTPPPMNSLNLVSAEGHNGGPVGGYRAHISFGSGASELGAVSEMELEYPTGEGSSQSQQNGAEEGHSSQDQHQYHSSSQQAGSQEPEGQEHSQHSQNADEHEQHLSQSSQHQSQSQHSSYSLQQAAETSV
ncbi:hypothetical protein BGZ97_010853 [Linnemannia gamsii]|uniref:Uncharacterized protein n=1 Tax=Linnemannia gamsii TaxID=64522 RepID=A0A9P6QMJ9_9FUNG|nr:hypothetical protein BGZ97_010853 [Linnemannia gamsii]